MSFTLLSERTEFTVFSGSMPPLRQLGHALEHALQLMQSSRRNVIMSSSAKNTETEKGRVL